ncbi:MAG: 6-phospho-beta-glucosidase [Anaerolineales bacterium]|nr:6-phospho-beta-glucosidase [Anaerolineales bacterium]
MKISVIGGGSTYTPELVSGFLEQHKTLPISELWLMDNNEERLDIVGGFAQRLVQKQGTPFEVRLTTDRRETIRDASFIITQFRVGGMAARQADEYLGQRHGLIGQETTGVGGMAKALRTIPVILEITKEISKLAPHAYLANFTNPAGLITEAASRYAPEINVIGMCNVAITTKMTLLKLLKDHTGIQLNPDEVALDTLGLNHLSWHRGLRSGEIDYWPQVLEAYIDDLNTQAEPDSLPHLIETLAMIPNYYLGYFYNHDKKLAAQETWPPSRAEEVMQIDSNLLRTYAKKSTVDVPEEHLQRGGAYYSTMATRMFNSIYNDLGEEHVVNVPNLGAVPSWPQDWVLELPCRIDTKGAHPLPAKPLPPVCYGLLAHVKAFELLTVEAAVLGDRNAAYQALLSHPLGPGLDQIEIVLEDILETNKEYLPQFWN